MAKSFTLVLLLALLAGCSTQFSTLEATGSSTQIVYAIPEDQAFQIAYGTLAATFPGRKIEVIDGPVRGYSTYSRFVLDTYTQQVLVHAVQGTDALGKKVRGYYFEVSGSGTSVLIGRSKNVELFDSVAAAAKATGKGVALTGIERVAYANARWRPGEGNAQQGTSSPASSETREDILHELERLKDLRDRGVITDQEFETKKKELLDRL